MRKAFDCSSTIPSDQHNTHALNQNKPHFLELSSSAVEVDRKSLPLPSSRISEFALFFIVDMVTAPQSIRPENSINKSTCDYPLYFTPTKICGQEQPPPPSPTMNLKSKEENPGLYLSCKPGFLTPTPPVSSSDFCWLLPFASQDSIR